jgi:hypothetical protein
MIKAPFSITDLDNMASDFLTTIRANFTIETDIDVLLAGNLGGVLTPVLEYIRNNFASIITGRPDQLDAHKVALDLLEATAKTAFRAANPAITRRAVNSWFKNNILELFNYDLNNHGFSRRNNGALAHAHAQRLNLNTCLYCNAQFTFTIWKTNLKMRPHFDHFYYKAKSPYFALSFYNLIPSCSVCNSNMKGVKQFLYRTHFHPFLDSMEGIFRFRSKISTVDFLVNKQDFRLHLEPCPGPDSHDKRRSAKNVEDFGLVDRYDWHKDYAGEIITKSYVYTHSAMADLMKDFEVVPGVQLLNSETEIKELLLGSFLHESRFHRRILSKLTKDIADEFGFSI